MTPDDLALFFAEALGTWHMCRYDAHGNADARPPCDNCHVRGRVVADAWVKRFRVDAPNTAGVASAPTL